MSQASQSDIERPFLEWLHQAGRSDALQDQLEPEDQGACIPINVSFGDLVGLQSYCLEALAMTGIDLIIAVASTASAYGRCGSSHKRTESFGLWCNRWTPWKPLLIALL